MNTSDVTRKLRAILSADVQGYSRLMGDDEVATVKTITEYRETISSLVSQYKGRVVDSPGDNVLAEFGSVVDAVQSAVEIQNILKAKNEELPENRRMIFRIGVNLGDVIKEGDRIYGDGVNIAARIESLAEGGGICISGTAYDQIENKLALGYSFFGEHSVKNIAKPVRVYKVPMEPGDVGKKRKGKPWKKAALAATIVLVLGALAFAAWNFYLRPPQIEPASVEKMAYSLPEKPSIAVLPFTNMSGNPAQNYIADGISENIISALSKISEIFVIARNSTFTYKNKAVKVQQVAEALGVRYVLEGSVLESGNKIRITVQLIDAITGYHLWSEKYDRKIEDFFQLLDEITYEIVVALQVKLTHGEQVRKWFGTTNFEAWSDVAKGLGIFETYTKANNEKARGLFENAVKIDPDCAFAWVMLGWTHFIDVRFAFTKTPAESLKKALQNAKKAQAIDDTLPDVPALLGSIYLIQRQYDKAIAEGQKSIELGPNSALSHVLFAQILYYSGNPEDAIAFGEQALRLCPNCPAWYSTALGKSYRTAGRYKDAIRVFKEVLERARKGEFPLWFANSNLAIAYAMMGQNEKARTHLAEAMKLNPGYSLELEGKINFYQDSNQLEAIFDALRKAGLRDKTSPAVADKPSIAVLPFDNMSGDPKEDYFCDGITENIITSLSKVEDMIVIARNSTFSYKGKSVNVKQVARELGVRYVLEGSIQRSKDRLRINAQLIDAETGNHLWAERYDRLPKEIFELQDEITMKVIEGLRIKIVGDRARAFSRGTENLEAYLKILKAVELYQHYNKDDIAIVRQLCHEAIVLDPNYSYPYAVLAFSYIDACAFGWTNSCAESYKQAFEFAQNALSLNDSDTWAHLALSTLYRIKKQCDKAVSEGARAVTLYPNGAGANMIYALALSDCSRHEEAIDRMKKAIHLNPISPVWYPWASGLIFFRAGRFEEVIPKMQEAIRVNQKHPVWFFSYLGGAYWRTGQYKEAVAAYKKALHINPDYLPVHIGLAISYSLAGHEAEARTEVAEVLRIDPKYSLEVLRNELLVSLKNEADKQRLIKALRKAGLN